MTKQRKRFAISKQLSEGLTQTVMAVHNNAGAMRFEVVPLEKIELDPDNPRELSLTLQDVKSEGLNKQAPDYLHKNKERESLRSLAYTIEKKGVLNPVWVYKCGEKYRLAAGERRVLASYLAGKEDIPAKILDDKPDLFDLRLIQWIENIERSDLSLYEKLNNIRMLLTAHPSLAVPTVTAAELGEILGCSRVLAHQYCVVLNAPQEIQAKITTNELKSVEKAAVIANIKSPTLRASVLQACLAGKNIKQLRAMAQASRAAKSPSAGEDVSLERRGRQAKKIHLGSTHSVFVVKTLLEATIAQHPKLNLQVQTLLAIDWQDYKAVNAAFKRLIQLLEAQAPRASTALRQAQQIVVEDQ